MERVAALPGTENVQARTRRLPRRLYCCLHLLLTGTRCPARPSPVLDLQPPPPSAPVTIPDPSHRWQAVAEGAGRAAGLGAGLMGIAADSAGELYAGATGVAQQAVGAAAAVPQEAVPPARTAAGAWAGSRGAGWQ